MEILATERRSAAFGKTRVARSTGGWPTAEIFPDRRARFTPKIAPGLH